MSSEENVWVENINVLFKKEYLFKYIPLENYSNYEKINSIMRLSIYFSIILSLLYQNLNYFFICIICGIITYIMYTSEDKKDENNMPKKTLENYKNLEKDKDIKNNKVNYKTYNKKCELPTRDNPFMNVLLTDKRDRKPACKSYNDEKIKNLVEDKFSKGLFKDINSLYNNENSQREFYTTPNTSIPNKQGELANWLYKVPPTCKEGNGFQCVGNNIEKLNGMSYQFI
jgi:hypothetical protein|uniref:Minor capsid protein P9 transmembrane helices domain-containing protein n=1 Tax=Mimiviridae sp. ChoanoV1 TaxID=2596887 RepID=A0A5B8HVV7_9VIRU|nr:hypothetical protein 1_158 [Mimiviridae sp. ChoanoV1]